MAYVFNVVADVPLQAERISYRSRSLAVKLILRLADQFGSEFGGTCDEFITVIDMDVELERTRLGRVLGDNSVFRKFVRKHDACCSEFDFCMPDAATRLRQPEFLFCSEGLFVKLDRLSCVFHAHIRKQFFYFHDASLSLTMPF